MFDKTWNDMKGSSVTQARSIQKLKSSFFYTNATNHLKDNKTVGYSCISRI
jgi:hypothetical protein